MWKHLSPQQRVDEIRAAHAATIGTASAIARVLSEKFNKEISRNSVIGFYHRNPSAFADTPLNGGSRGRGPSEARSAKPAAPPRQQKARPAPVRKETAEPLPVFVMPPEPASLNVSLIDLERSDCRWPTDGDGAQMLFCGHPKLAETSYCSHHHFRSLGPAGIVKHLSKAR